MRLGRKPSRIRSTIRRPDCLANQSLWAVGAGGGGRAGEGQANGLRETLHGVCCTQQGAGAGGGADGFLQLREGIVGEARASYTAGPGLGVQIGDDHVLALVPSRQHRPARDQDGGTVEPGRRQEMAGDVLVATADEDKSVEAVDLGAGLHVRRDDIPGRRVVAHPAVPHVHRALPEAAEFERRPARLPDTSFDRVSHRPQVDVTGAGLAPGVGHADPRKAQVFGVVTHGLDQGAGPRHPRLVEGLDRCFPC